MGIITGKGSNKDSCSANKANKADDGKDDCLIVKSNLEV